MSTLLQSSNPILTDSAVYEETHHLSERSDTASLQGIVNKTGLMVLLAIVAGGGGYMLVGSFPAVQWISAIAAFGLVIGVGFVLRGKPQLAPVVTPIYAIVEGIFLGALTGALDSVLAGMGYAAAGSIALQAFIITISLFVAMLALYSFRIIRPTKTFTAVVGTLTAGIMLTYLASFVLSFFGVALPFINLGSAMQGGTGAMIGLGLNILILGVAALWLVIDFKLVEDIVDSGQPKHMEWYATFALLVSLAWVYFEAVKLAFRLALMNRD